MKTLIGPDNKPKLIYNKLYFICINGSTHFRYFVGDMILRQWYFLSDLGSFKDSLERQISAIL